ncbi:YibL family ribosome-associated protein [Erwinia sp.]|uniref:YibL family ribosome-associated protein n=1 Tax=Erwinia citreus TaxID=558 RepID=UPI003C76A561
MKEEVQAEIRILSDKLDALNYKEQPLLASGDTEKLGELLKEKDKLIEELERLRGVREQKLSAEAQKLKDMPFSRPITKKEQANMGAFKKSVRGLVVVHPMTALGREMGLQEMTGFSKTAF